MRPKLRNIGWILLSAALVSDATAETVLRNSRYAISTDTKGIATIISTGMAAHKLTAEFTVLWSTSNSGFKRNVTHLNYVLAPRNAVRWACPAESIPSLNDRIASPQFRAATGLSGTIYSEGAWGRVWQFRDAEGKVALRVTGKPALDTTLPFAVGSHAVVQPVSSTVKSDRVVWDYASTPEFSFSAELALPPGEADPVITFTLTPKVDAFFSVAFTGTPEAALSDTIPVPQECEARNHKLFDFVMSEADLHLPRVHVCTNTGNIALAADPRECRFRLPTIDDSRFGLMLLEQGDRLKPVIFAPLLGGAESRMHTGQRWQFTFRCIIRAGSWIETYSHIARHIFGLRDQRDNSGPGSLNGTLERVMDFLADRHGGNHALWDAQQKYYDYFTDKTGVFKPFSPLYGLSAAIVTDDEAFFRQRALPAVEFALSRQTKVFAPYDAANNKQANSAGHEVGGPCIGYVPLATLHELFRGRTPAFRAMAESIGPEQGKLADALTHWKLTGEASALSEARQDAVNDHGAFDESDLFDRLDLADATRDARDVAAAIAAAYANSAQLNLYPVPPDTKVTVDPGGFAPVHPHSVSRHHNIWGFPPPQPIRTPEQTVPAWRIARLGVPGPAYPMEYWMNTHGAMMRVAGLAHDGFLRDVARWGMVGRFGNYAGDNRSLDSLVAELPNAVDRMPWEWNFATVNPGHAWDFAGAVLDFLVSDAFERSHGAIDFPALSAAGSHFRVRIYGGKTGQFYGDKDVRLWLPRGLVTSDNRQVNWLASYGNGMLYLALCNQSFRAESVAITLNSGLAECDPSRDARVWHDNTPSAPVRVRANQLKVTLGSKGISAFAIPATVKPQLQAKLDDSSTQPLGNDSFKEISAPFGKVHAMLIQAGRGLTRAFVYTEALPENVIAARLRWRQGQGTWHAMTDEIYPFEFSPELADGPDAFTCVLEIENAKQEIQRSPVIVLNRESKEKTPPDCVIIPASTTPILPSLENPQDSPELLPGISNEFIAYVQNAANGSNFGLRADGRYYPYSTPLGRRIGWRQPIWDKALFARGCTGNEAEQHLRGELSRALAALKSTLSSRQTPVDFARLDKRQQETLLDFAYTETPAPIPAKFLAAVLVGDWQRVTDEHLYIRYTGHTPDHVRNKAFALRWNLL